MKQLIKAFLPYGFIWLYRKIKNSYFKVKPTVTVDSLLNFKHLKPFIISYKSNPVKRLNLVLNSLNKESLFGGVATCCVIATLLAKKINLSLRIISRSPPLDEESFHNLLKTLGIEHAQEILFYSEWNKNESGSGTSELEISENDIFFASSWWTAHALTKNIDKSKIYHIIQEAESMFYPQDYDHYLCTNILNDKHLKYIINSRYLFEYFKTYYPGICERGVFFDPAFPVSMRPKFEEKKRYKLFFYARLSNPRNLFYYGISIIETCLKQGIIDPSEWDIYLAGDHTIPNIKLHKDVKAIDLGILSWNEYKAFLQDIDLGLTLIYTPHPGYPVYDVASSGGVAITNTLYNKQSFPECKNIIASELEETIFIENMKTAIALAKDHKKREDNYHQSTIPDSWEKTLATTLQFLSDKIVNPNSK